jgi:hypothetical protein
MFEIWRIVILEKKYNPIKNIAKETYLLNIPAEERIGYRSRVDVPLSEVVHGNAWFWNPLFRSGDKDYCISTCEQSAIFKN